MTINAAVCELDWRSVCEFGAPTDRFDVLVARCRKPIRTLLIRRTSTAWNPIARRCWRALKGVSRRGCLVLVEGAAEVDPALAGRSGEVIVVERSGHSGGTIAGPNVLRIRCVGGEVRIARGHAEFSPLLRLDTFAETVRPAPSESTPLLAAIAAARALGVSPAFIVAGWDRYL